ncbi:AraC family transcriptional regulator [Paenibacillus tritici]|uniref:AraC family transcriptional regulator n=1 Tax=Paenibacillus tritici TaxID=1873425 RepID=UPI001BACCD85|nr:AraC family transcriptional regulator [Paenibacillus tritici]QUL55208.1 AraC family transcriptional regulator [Paenibacillus tritici]
MNYYDKVQQTIDYIELHLTEDLSPAIIAEQIFFSLTHFYRIFRGLVGESVKEYIRKRRLSQSAIELLAGEKRIIEIAMEYGFESQETFSRAFTKQFGITPGRYRRDKNVIVLYEKANIGQRLNIQRAIQSSGSVHTKIVYKKAFQVIGLQAMVRPGSGTIAELWTAFNAKWPEMEGLSLSQARLGICEYYPDITDESDFSYIACKEAAQPERVPSGMISRRIPSSKYAVFSHDDSIYHLKDTYQFIYGVWLPESGYELAELDTIEYYEPNVEHSDYELAIYIPIQ